MRFYRLAAAGRKQLKAEVASFSSFVVIPARRAARVGPVRALSAA